MDVFDHADDRNDQKWIDDRLHEEQLRKEAVMSEVSRAISELQRRIGEVNIANGWRSGSTAEPMTPDKAIVMLALITTEVAEAIEEVRNGRAVHEEYFTHKLQPGVTFTRAEVDESEGIEASFKPEGVPSELADVVIRALDAADAWGIDLGDVIERKLAYNATRGYRHGGKRA